MVKKRRQPARKAKSQKHERAPTPFGQRVRDAMKVANVKTEAELLTKIHELFPGDEHEQIRSSQLTQQMVNHILTYRAERSYYSPVIAAALEVPSLWLAFGVGEAPSKQRDAAVQRPAAPAGDSYRSTSKAAGSR